MPPTGPEGISSFRVFFSLSVKRAEGNCPFPLNDLTAEDEKRCAEGRCDHLAGNLPARSAPCSRGGQGLCGRLGRAGLPPGCSLLELSMVQSDVQGST